MATNGIKSGSGSMPGSGHYRRFDRLPVTTGLPLQTDIVGPPRHIRVVPTTDELVIPCLMRAQGTSLSNHGMEGSEVGRIYVSILEEVDCRQFGLSLSRLAKLHILTAKLVIKNSVAFVFGG
jgi:hypothetical protein